MAGKFKIEALNPSFKGTKDGVEFVDGIGFTDNVMIRKRFEEAGCTTHDVESGKQIYPEVPGEDPTSVFGDKKVSA